MVSSLRFERNASWPIWSHSSGIRLESQRIQNRAAGNRPSA